MRGKKYLAKNIILLTISQMGSKLLSFLLVPLYTSVLSSSEYGTYDLFNTTITLLIPLLTVNIADAVLRFALDNKDEKDIFTIGIKYFSLGTGFITIALIVNHILRINSLVDHFAIYIFLLYVATSINGVINNFSRGIDSVKEVAIGGLICSAIMLSLNIYFLLYLKLGLAGYFGANIIGLIVQSIYLIISLRLWRYCTKQITNKLIEKEMINYAKPLIANNIAWWVNSSSDRYIVTWISGLAANGIYSVGYKIPSILNVFQTIFSQAWTLSAVKDFDPKDKNNFFTNMYNLYNFGMIFVCSILILATRIIAHVLYAKQFYNAWIYVPWLLISIVFGSISGYIGGIFAAVKDSKIFAQTTVLSAIVNTVLNIVLVLWIGPLGAAISTAFSYFITWLIRIIVVRRYITLHLKVLRDSIAYIILVLQTLSLYLFKNTLLINYAIQVFLLVVLIILFFTQFKQILKNIRKVIKK